MCSECKVLGLNPEILTPESMRWGPETCKLFLPVKLENPALDFTASGPTLKPTFGDFQLLLCPLRHSLHHQSHQPTGSHSNSVVGPLPGGYWPRVLHTMSTSEMLSRLSTCTSTPTGMAGPAEEQRELVKAHSWWETAPTHFSREPGLQK